MFICASGEEFDFANVVGVGLIESAIRLSEICIKDKPQEIIFVGSAGSYDERIGVFDIYQSHLSTQIEFSYIFNNAYSPIENIVAGNTFANVSRENDIIVNSSNYISRDSSFALTMINNGILLENMEFYSILSVAKHFNIPAFGILCVTNYCNVNAHEDFIKNHKKAKELLESYVKKNLL